ncbi:MAG TPA: energy transducer TonB [Porticoccaceae bacterium]|nr:energy transducer TonB [Porticoccaceae bacterium]
MRQFPESLMDRGRGKIMSGRALAFALATFGLVSGAFASNEIMRETVSWRMKLDATGHIARLEPLDSSNRALQEKLEPTVRAWEFVPGAVDGKPAATDTVLSVQVALQPIADSQQLSVIVEDARTGGRISAATRPPRFPYGAYDKLAREGGFARYFIEVRYDGTGTVRDAVAMAGSTEGIDALWRSAEKAVRNWEYEPEKVAGIGVPGTLIVPVCFSVGATQKTALETMARCEWTRPGSKVQIREGESVALESSVLLKTEVIGRTL